MIFLVILLLVGVCAWAFDVQMLKNLFLFGTVGFIVLGYEKVFDWVMSFFHSDSESSKGRQEAPEKNEKIRKKKPSYWQGSDIRNCATCEYWSGDRKLDSSKRGISFDQFDHAICAGGGRDKVNVSAVQICQKYVKMRALK